ncbi:uncharacterized protein H6S33_010515 [Morchella sextelata]|uniref:uncharacterized protein n=1 Tax=Morchella sextelata TaxID=1174677 RepID=UPI001D049FF4|nr:uncharacterized protein H6S33_010515 [Morchella sextelata]KAH0602198.1 hypothetical protein H6S33_010515 [Morchella sextelata]
MITEKDYVIAWDAVSADTASDASVRRFCADNCLTHAENLEDLREMCSDIEIEEFPFIDAMVFANLIEEDNGTVVAVGIECEFRAAGAAGGDREELWRRCCGEGGYRGDGGGVGDLGVCGVMFMK